MRNRSGLDLWRVCGLALIPVVVLGSLLVGGMQASSAPLQRDVQASPPPLQAASPQSSGWEEVPVYPGPMMTVEMWSPTNVWVGGYETILHYVGSPQWAFFSVGEEAWVTGMQLLDLAAGWGVTSRGNVLILDSQGWKVHTTPTDAWLDDIKMVGGADGWAVGEQGTILRYGGGAWPAVTSPTTKWLLAVDMVNANDGWIVGSKVILRWTGAGWTISNGSLEAVLKDVEMVDANNGWAVGAGGAIYHYEGSTWEPVPSPTGSSLNAVDMLPDGTGWAVGNHGTILHYDGQSWELYPSPTSYELLGLSMLNASDGWAVGRQGTFLHYSGEPDLSPSSKTVTPLHAGSGDVLTYNINVKNSGTVAASSVVVTDSTPAGTTYKAGSATTSKGTIDGTDPLVVTVGDVGPSEEVTIGFEVTVDETGSDCWFVVNEAQIAANETLTRTAIATIGDSCYRMYLPVASRDP
jgi:uncharacterized repeat protein (TIGR01451 family)